MRKGDMARELIGFDMAREFIGWHMLKWFGGTFEICFRPGGNFYCPKFPAQTTWKCTDGKVIIDWGDYGKYEMSITEGNSMTGHALPKDESDPTNWRKSKFLRAFSPVEALLFGDGMGTEWYFQYNHGGFLVEFKCDGYNRFICSHYPSHSIWSLDGNKLLINWGAYGKYELMIDLESESMAGHMVGGDPMKDWRTAKFKRNLAERDSLHQGRHQLLPIIITGDTNDRHAVSVALKTLDLLARMNPGRAMVHAS